MIFIHNVARTYEKCLGWNLFWSFQDSFINMQLYCTDVIESNSRNLSRVCFILIGVHRLKK